MPEYNLVTLKNNSLFGPDMGGFEKYLSKHIGEILKFTVEPLVPKASKTPAELGYYWGILLPAITRELIAQGHTFSVPFGDGMIEIPLNKDNAHEWLTKLCGRVGDNGEHKRLSACDKFQAAKYIDNCLSVAAQLGMDVEALKTWREKIKEIACLT